jgi:6-phosphogluconolactonase (cycloisomerase 2 family)
MSCGERASFGAKASLILAICAATTPANAGHPHLVFSDFAATGVLRGDGLDGECLVSKSGDRICVSRPAGDMCLTGARGRSGNVSLSGGCHSPGSGYGWHPTVLVLNRDDRFLYVAADQPFGIVMFTDSPNGDKWYLDSPWNREAAYGPGRNVDSSRPGPGTPGLRRPRGMAMSPDDRNLYVTSEADYSLFVFLRETSNGSLTPIQVFQDESCEEPSLDIDDDVASRLPHAVIVAGLKEARSVLVTRDGLFVYVAAPGSRAVSVFRRDPQDGRLTFVEALHESRAVGLTSPRHLVLSPDQRNIYVACGPDSIVALGRNLQTGRLHWRQTLRSDQSVQNGLENPQKLAINSAGSFVFVAARGNEDSRSALTMFARHPQSGELRFSHTLKAADHPEYRIEGIASVCVSGDGKNVYTTSRTATVSVFTVRSN